MLKRSSSGITFGEAVRELAHPLALPSKTASPYKRQARLELLRAGQIKKRF